MTLVDIKCEDCGAQMEPVWFKDRRNDGRVRLAVDYLICPCCLATQCVDDSFDGPWYRPNH